eukprot:364777-Chlamydomonas_euryale.AAC.8
MQRCNRAAGGVAAGTAAERGDLRVCGGGGNRSATCTARKRAFKPEGCPERCRVGGHRLHLPSWRARRERGERPLTAGLHGRLHWRMARCMSAWPRGSLSVLDTTSPLYPAAQHASAAAGQQRSQDASPSGWLDGTNIPSNCRGSVVSALMEQRLLGDHPGVQAHMQPSSWTSM